MLIKNVIFPGWNPGFWCVEKRDDSRLVCLKNIMKREKKKFTQILENKNVFSFFLKVSKDFCFLVSTSKLFQILGPAELKAREATTVLVRGSSRRNVPADRRSQTNTFSDNNSLRYDGAEPSRHRKTSEAILKRTRCVTGSQCSSLKSGAAGDLNGLFRTILARLFWTRCSLFRY